MLISSTSEGSRLYQSQFLQLRSDFAGFFKPYKICTLLHYWVFPRLLLPSDSNFCTTLTWYPQQSFVFFVWIFALKFLRFSSQIRSFFCTVFVFWCFCLDFTKFTVMMITMVEIILQFVSFAKYLYFRERTNLFFLHTFAPTGFLM